MRWCVPCIAALLMPVASEAGLLDDLKAKAKQVITDKTERKSEDAVDTGVSGATPKPNPASTSAPAPASASAGSASPAAGAQTLKAYQNYDFSTGDQILFEDDFATDELGEFPAHWNQLDGQGTVNDVNGRRAFLLTAPDRENTVTPAIKSPRYLGDSFTIEFDSISVSGGFAPTVFFYDQAPNTKTNGRYIGRVRFQRNNFYNFEIQIGGDWNQQFDYPPAIGRENFVDRWHHYAIAFRNKRLKVYVDQNRIWSSGDLAIAPHAVAFDSAGTQDKPGVLAGVRIANGSNIKVADKKFVDAKIVTHGIHFDTDRATLRPESMGALNAVVEVLKNNPDLMFEVQGHTDNSGGAAHNLTLSQQRSDAVRAQLVTMGVDAGRLTSRGMGDTAPMASNDTPEGRANNRRVEFVRK
jgi:outer membrane protein OmpA-like peptidoglycan-associated protein